MRYAVLVFLLCFAREARAQESVAVIRTLYATTATLQGLDAYSTLAALDAGHQERNPLVQGVADRPVAFVAVKAGVTALSIYTAQKLWKEDHRKSAIVLLVASNVFMTWVNVSNARHLSAGGIP